MKRQDTRFSFSLSFSLGLSNSRARGEVSKNRSIHAFSIAHCSAKRLKASPAVRAGFTNWCRASITTSALSSTLGFYQHQFHPKRFGTLLAQVIRKLSSIIAWLVCSSFIRVQSVDLPTTFSIIEECSIISRCCWRDLMSIWEHNDS